MTEKSIKKMKCPVCLMDFDFRAMINGLCPTCQHQLEDVFQVDRSKKMAIERPIQKVAEDWTLLDRAYDMIDGEVFGDLDSIFSYYVLDEIESNINSYPIEQLSEIGVDLDMIMYCLKLAKEQELKQFEKYFGSVQIMRNLSEMIDLRMNNYLYGDDEE